MTVIKCPNCGESVTIDIAKCIDEDGEVHRCPKCRSVFRYVDR